MSYIRPKREGAPATRTILPCTLAGAGCFAVGLGALLFLCLRWQQLMPAPRGVWLLSLGALLLGLLLLLRGALNMCWFEDLLIQLEQKGVESTEELAALCGNRFVYRGIGGMLETMKQTVDREYTMQILDKQAEINALQSQINPHFLYNTLEAIRGKAALEDMWDIAEMAKALADFFRYSISRQGDMATLEEELQHLERYILIQQHRFNNKFLVTHSIANEALLAARLPKMTLQPIIENAIYHGLETKVGSGSIHIGIQETASRIAISISDDGIGIEEEVLLEINRCLLGDIATPSSQGMSIALTNINRRLRLCFGEGAGLKIFSAVGQGTDVEITLPKQRAAGEGEEEPDATGNTAHR